MNEDIVRQTVAVHPASSMALLAPTLQVLATLFPVRFVAHEGVAWPCHGLISFDSSVAEQAYRMGLPVLCFPEVGRPDGIAVQRVRFEGNPILQPCLRGLEIRVEADLQHRPAPCDADDLIVAAVGDAPLWTERRNGKASLRKLMLDFPELAAGKPLFPQLLRGGWIQWLPLFHFLRELTADIDWQSSGLRACFMFDDPNLHWSSWGFLDYRELAAHARHHCYHASMATVPLDMWFAHSPTAELFREQAQYLSLLVHGVEHAREEMQRPMAASRRLGDLNWSLNQVREFEDRYGLKVSRVMAPPHHACSLEAASLMLHAGYEAACVAWLRVIRSNPGIQWRPEFGLQCAEFLGDGLPVVPRFNFADQDPGRAVLAAFFHQPLIMIGHHQDVAGGLQILADWARFVNSLGPVRWTNLEEIVHSNYLTRRVKDTLYVKLGARKVCLAVPQGVNQIVLVRPWLAADQLEPVCLLGHGNMSTLPALPGGQAGPFAVLPGEQLTVQCTPPKQSQAPFPPHSFRLWPMARRLACEMRDRLLPLVTKAQRATASPSNLPHTRALTSRS